MDFKDYAKKLYPYYSVPYKLWGQDVRGSDCYGFVVLLYRDLFGIDIEQPIPIKGERGMEKREKSLSKFFSPFKEVQDPKFMDIALFLNGNGLPLHVGIYLENKQIINMNSEEGVHVIKLDCTNILSKQHTNKLAGFFRHEAFF